ncbi:MAG: molybdenum cofactor guanylyltransferase [Acidobacteriota bacterium]|nr:molybdenum cofactor guanylyltransferase [Acidobacteriota bacterium]
MTQNDFVTCAGMILTGGGSRRMGRDKAAIAWPDPDSPTLAVRTATLLTAVCPTAVEVGPGHTELARVREAVPGGGPLAALVAGWRGLVAAGWTDPVLVVATDLPLLSEGLLRWLADFPDQRSVVPLAGGRVQPLCARYSPADLDLAARLLARGRRALLSLVEDLDAAHPDEAVWAAPAGHPAALDDADTPGDLTRMAGR